jgi:hypothetical protein
MVPASITSPVHHRFTRTSQSHIFIVQSERFASLLLLTGFLASQSIDGLFVAKDLAETHPRIGAEAGGD